MNAINIYRKISVELSISITEIIFTHIYRVIVQRFKNWSSGILAKTAENKLIHTCFIAISQQFTVNNDQRRREII